VPVPARESGTLSTRDKNEGHVGQVPAAATERYAAAQLDRISVCAGVRWRDVPNPGCRKQTSKDLTPSAQRRSSSHRATQREKPLAMHGRFAGRAATGCILSGKRCGLSCFSVAPVLEPCFAMLQIPLGGRIANPLRSTATSNQPSSRYPPAPGPRCPPGRQGPPPGTTPPPPSPPPRATAPPAHNRLGGRALLPGVQGRQHP
jgi:hypothetical protein